jgi:putrescine aminotransferase
MNSSLLAPPALVRRTQNQDTKAIQALDSAHFFHPFTDHGDLATRGSRVMTHAEGIYVWDSEGRKVLDAMSGLWCVNAGYARKELADAAYQQMMTLPYYNSFFQTTNVPAVQLATKLASLAPKVGERSFEHVFYSSSGSESNDTNVRMVRRYWDLLGQPQRKVIIGRSNGYHGSTMASASLGGMSGMHAQGDLPIPNITHIGQPYYFENGLPGETAEEFGIRAAGWLEEKILQIGPDKVAAFIGEPVQGAGGVIIPPSSYWPEIQRIVDKYGILLISDEVICAFGRLGAWFAYEQFGMKPDLVTFAKGVTSGYIPLGGVMVGNRVAKVLIEQGGEFNHGYTYSGHPVACAVALANLELMEREQLVQRVHDDVGPYLARRFAELKQHPLVGDAETCGFVAGLVLVKDKATKQLFAEELGVGMVCRSHCFGNGLIMRAVGDRMIIAPPLTMTHAQIDEMMALIVRCLDLTYDDARKNGGWHRDCMDAL